MSQLPYAIALVAGMLAALNPCGFAMLPGYLALLVASGDDDAAGATAVASWRPLARALATTAAMTAGFTAVFVAFGLLVVPLALSLERHLPWATVVIGAALVVLGAWLLAGRKVGFLLPRPSPGRPVRSLRWAAAYGVTYAVASLSCTIGPFLALTTSALRSTSPLGMLGVFVVYAAGMGLVIGTLTVAVALARDSVAHRLRRALPYVTRAGGALLVLAGAYVAYYGWFELRVLSGAADTDPVVDTAVRWQAELARLLQQVGAGRVALALAALTTISTVVVLVRRRRTGAGERSTDRLPER
ncbi:cytochrome c biogenesis CcdA family protein [Nocardiopsis sp. NRRL B-16309]|uniref:cytochrome c biogenesis CcdA family protein n=1 Tax=Nocardiopsis sp. NRRL B-16309 TaxID=1519494 RepID=UPI0006AF4C17|nr:cytochrome c biogenesis protein CcdA [Nocardiopsis sp. NRRL B-16309]KOX16486.1 cytochrome C biogenesis protein [Nocardiopsis sp. NRRL B-16309]